MNKVPLFYVRSEEHKRQMAQAINDLIDGHTNASGRVELTGLLTTVDNERSSEDSFILLSPADAVAAAKILYATPLNGSFTINAPSAGGFVNYLILKT